MSVGAAVHTRVVGTGHYVPARVLDNHDLERMVQTSDAWITERTGIRARRIADPGEVTSDLATQAAKQALDAAGLDAAELDLILCATVTPDQPLPSTAMAVQAKLGVPHACPCFDLAAACAGFIYGLAVADAFIRSGQARRVLLVGVELLSRVVDWQERSTCVLFGDGAGAVVLSGDASAGPRLCSTHIYGDGRHRQLLHIPAGGSAKPASAATVAAREHYVAMEGQEVFKIAVKSLTAASQAALQHNQLTPQQVDWVIAHQANLRIVEAVAKRCEIPLERFFLNIERYGNTSSASVPIVMDEATRQGQLQPGQHVLLCALGGGLAWGSALLQW
ncbi:MAG: beta-ketoacyl-ACP synthase III [Polyangiales bacterium]